MSTDITRFAVPEGPGSVTSAPNLPDGFTETFSSRIVETGGLRQHVVIGGDGPPLLLVHGWPESWYAWRLVMPTLARDFTVVAVDQRGMGLTDKPETGYDSGTLAADLIALMDALGFDRFAVAGHDTGMVISYALAADNPDRVASLIAAEIPGAPGAVPAPPLFVPQPLNNKLWHIPFNRAGRIAEQLVRAARTSSSATSSRSRAARPARGGHRLLRRQLRRPGVAARRPRVLPRLGRHDGAERERAKQTLRCRSSRSAARPAGATTSGTGCGRPPRTCRPPSSPAPATGWPNRRPTSCLACSGVPRALPRVGANRRPAETSRPQRSGGPQPPDRDAGGHVTTCTS